MGQIAKRDKSFDALRGTAILCVVAIHSIILPNNPQSKGLEEISFWLTVFFRQMLNFAVPAFLFMSGYFCSRQDVFSEGAYSQFLKRRIPKVLIPYLVWSLILLIGFPAMKSGQISWGEIPYKLLTAGASGPYYFVLLIIQFYVLPPLLLKLVNSGWRGGVLVLIINTLVLGCLYLCRFVFHVSVPFELYALPAYSWLIFYYFGLYMGHNRKVESWLSVGLKGWVALAVSFYFASCIEAVVIIKESGAVSFGMSAIKLSSFAFSLSVIAVFFGAKSRIKRYPRVLLLIGDYSFGIYLIHMIFLSRFVRQVGKAEVFSALPVLPVVCLTIITTLVCMSVVYGARKVLGRKIGSEVFGL